MQEIIIRFPKSCDGIKLIDVEELRQYYGNRGEIVPPTFVFMPYARIAENDYVVLPFGKDIDAAQQGVHWTAFGTGWLARLGKFIFGLGWRLAQIGSQ